MELDLGALGALGVSRADIEHPLRLPHQEGVAALQALQKRVRKQLREAALVLHPDRTNNDHEKTEQLKRLTAAVTALESCRLPPPAPPPPAVVWAGAGAWSVDIFVNGHRVSQRSNGATVTSTTGVW